MFRGTVLLRLFIVLVFLKNASASEFETVKEKLFPKLLNAYVTKSKRSKNKPVKEPLAYSAMEYYLGIKYSGAVALGIFYEKHKDIYADRRALFEKYLKYALPKTTSDPEISLLKEAVRYGQLIYKYKSGKIYVKRSNQLFKKLDLIEEFPLTDAAAGHAVDTGSAELILRLLNGALPVKKDKKDKKPKTMAEVRGMESNALSRLTESSMPELHKDIFATIEPVIDICRNSINEDDPLLDLFNFLTSAFQVQKLEQERQHCLDLIFSALPDAGTLSKEDRDSIDNLLDDLYTFAFATYGNNIRLGMDLFNKIHEKGEGSLLLDNGVLAAWNTEPSSMLAAVSKDSEIVFFNLPESLIDMGFSAVTTMQDDKWEKLQKLIVKKDSNIKDAMDASADIFVPALKDEKFLNLTGLVGRAAVYALKGLAQGTNTIDNFYASFRDNLKYLSFLNIIGMDNVKDADFIDKISINIPKSDRKCLKVRNRKGRRVCRY
jgi:hypothetical protein